jgi:exoribonuclease R
MGLFRDGDRPVSLYAPLPLEGGVETQEGRIVQAFVKPAESGFAAVPLIDLGRDITPEIAAREIAFRYGARGYFEGGVIRQAEEIGRTEDPQAEFARIREAVAKSGKGKVADLRGKPFITIDPAGAGDLDDAFFVEKNPDGGFTWYLATADVAQHVAPGTPAFRHAARVGNTFYSIDKDGVPEYPMNHPVVSKYVSSLLNGKDSIAMISRLSFDANGVLDKEGSEVFLGVIRVQGRYSYDQVAALWNGRKDHGIGHVDQVNVARELSRKLDRQDGLRGKIKLDMANLEHFKRKNGWVTESVVEDPLAKESHLLIEELKVYGNQEIATLLNRITQEFRVPHVSRIHPEQSPSVNARMEKELNGLGVPWTQGNIWEYLARLNGRIDLSPELKQAAQMLVLTSRRSARYALEDADGHEGLALEAGAYDHPSTPIRRFSDMYNRALLEAYLEGGDPKKVYEAVVADVKSMGFEGLEEYVEHLNAREKAAKQMDYAVDDFMSVYELAKPENQGRTFTGHVKMVRKGDAPSVSIQLKEVGAALVVRGVAAKNYKLLDEVQVRVKGADLESQNVDADIRVVKSFAAPSEAKQGKGNKQWKGKGKGKKFSGSAPRRRRR